MLCIDLKYSGSICALRMRRKAALGLHRIDRKMLWCTQTYAQISNSFKLSNYFQKKNQKNPPPKKTQTKLPPQTIPTNTHNKPNQKPPFQPLISLLLRSRDGIPKDFYILFSYWHLKFKLQVNLN